MEVYNRRPIICLCTIVHYSCALFPYFTVAIYIFHVALFSLLHLYCTISKLHFLCSNLFMLHFFSCCSFFMALFNVALLHVAIFSFCILLLLHSSHVAIFPRYTLLMLHYFQRCSQDPHKHLRWRAMQHFSHVALFSCCTFSMLHFFHVALFPCCSLLILHFFMLHFYHVPLFFMLHSFHIALF